MSRMPASDPPTVTVAAAVAVVSAVANAARPDTSDPVCCGRLRSTCNTVSLHRAYMPLK